MPNRVPLPRYRAIPAWVSSPRHRAVILALVEARGLAGMTQRDLAAKLRRPQSFVAKVEAIERNLSVLELLEWTAALGIEPSSVLAQSHDDTEG